MDVEKYRIIILSHQYRLSFLPLIQFTMSWDAQV